MDLDDDKTGTLYHVQSSRRLCFPPAPAPASSDREYFLTIDPAARTTAECLAVDYDTLVILPKFVAFKGSNGLYYKNYTVDADAHFSVSEIADPNIKCEIEYTSDGNIRVIASNNPAVCWTCYGPGMKDLIACAYNNADISQVFTLIRINKNTIALRNLGNNKICKRRADVNCSHCKTDGLVATADGLEKDTYLEVFETVLSRTVKTYDFDLDKANIYDVELLYSSEHVWDNYTDVAESGTANGTIKTKKIHTYNNNLDVSGSVSTTFKTGIPYIADGAISFSASASYSHEWGTSEEEEQEIGDVFTVVVQPMKRTIARGVATRGTCDVPFSYVQKDYPLNGGSPIITKLNDGVFTTTNAYNFKDEVRFEDLPPHEGPPEAALNMCLQRSKKKRVY